MNSQYYMPPPSPYANQQAMFYPPKQPYPTQGKQKQQQPSQFSSFVSQFKTSDGNYDVNKMMIQLDK